MERHGWLYAVAAMVLLVIGLVFLNVREPIPLDERIAYDVDPAETRRRIDAQGRDPVFMVVGFAALAGAAVCATLAYREGRDRRERR